MDNTPQKYNSIDMPMSVFMNAYCDGDLSQVENYDDIKLDYQIALGGKALDIQLADSLEYQKLNLKVQLAKALIASLDLRRYVRQLIADNAIDAKSVEHITKAFELKSDEQIFTELKALRYHIMLPNANMIDSGVYSVQINGWIMNDMVTLSELANEQKNKKKKEEGAQVIQDRNYFTDRFIAINGSLHLNINETSSVRMFCRAAVQYINYCERQAALNAEQK